MSDPTINYELLAQLADKPHPLLNIADDFEKQIREIPIAWTGEVFTEARTAHHLLDLADVPHGEGYAQDLDARTWLAVAELGRLRERLDRIKAWHGRPVLAGGLVADECTECQQRWPCETLRLAEGAHEDLTEEI